MAKKSFVIRANFPTQATDLVENIEAGSWPAALGMAARLMKKRLPGRRVKAASFTIEQVEVAAPPAPVAEQQPLVQVGADPVVEAPAAEEAATVATVADATGDSTPEHNNS